MREFQRTLACIIRTLYDYVTKFRSNVGLVCQNRYWALFGSRVLNAFSRHIFGPNVGFEFGVMMIECAHTLIQTELLNGVVPMFTHVNGVLCLSVGVLNLIFCSQAFYCFYLSFEIFGQVMAYTLRD